MRKKAYGYFHMLLRVYSKYFNELNKLQLEQNFYFIFSKIQALEKEQHYIISKAIGSALKHARMNAAISIAKISNDLKINPSTIVSIEDGKHQTSFCIIYGIMTYLKIDSKLLFDQIEIALKEKR